MKDVFEDATVGQAADGFARERIASTGYPARSLPNALFIIEKHKLIRQLLERALRGKFDLEILSFSNVTDWIQAKQQYTPSLILLSAMSLTGEERESELSQLRAADRETPIVVVFSSQDLDDALDLLRHGASGCITDDHGLDVAVEAMRFVQNGGKYVPAQYVLSRNLPSASSLDRSPTDAFTNRELAVINEIRRGKPNKVIAYDLNMCESTVKVHLRRIMKKMAVRNRTAVALKADQFLHT